MARLKNLPSLDIIRGFRGCIDYYLWKGVPCARSWPRFRPENWGAPSRAAAELFGAVVTAWSLTGSTPKSLYNTDARDQPRTARDIYVSAVLGHLHETTPPTPPPPEEQMYNAYVCVRDKKTQNTPGGTFTMGAWRTRTLNEEHSDQENIATLVANQVTLPAGSYRCLIRCPAYRVARHQARLYNTDDAAEILPGTSTFTDNAHNVANHSVIQGRFTIAAPKTLEVQHQCQTTYATYGFGVESNFTDEIYTVAEFWRETP